jgi:hypothetical protein
MKVGNSLGSPDKFNTVMTDDLMTWEQLQTYGHAFTTGKLRKTGDEYILIVFKCIKLLINNYSLFV